jgi:hypothetical protein
LSDVQKVACAEAAKEMLRILHESEINDFDGIATADESWFQHTTTSSKVFARSAADVIPRTRHPSYSPDTTPSNLYFFGNLKKKLPSVAVMNRACQIYIITEIFSDARQDGLIAVYQNWMNPFRCVIKNNHSNCWTACIILSCEFGPFRFVGESISFVP